MIYRRDRLVLVCRTDGQARRCIEVLWCVRGEVLGVLLPVQHGGKGIGGAVYTVTPSIRPTWQSGESSE